MEVLKKTKKLKKRRHRYYILKKEKLEDDIDSLDQEKVEASSELEYQLMSQSVQTDFFEVQENRESIVEKDEQIKHLSDRVQQITTKLYESKNAYTSLKQEYNKLQKLLCSEVGENVTPALLKNHPGGWRGRAEQIQQLQQKVSELQLKLPDNNSTRRGSIERRSLSGARVFDREKKQQIENLTKDLKEAEIAQENIKKKLEAAKARKAVLENDLSISKKTIAFLNEKTVHDNQLIEALHAQLKLSESKLEEKDAAIRRQSEKYEREIVLIKSELEAAEIHMKNFKRQIDEKEKELENLKTKYGVLVNSNTLPIHSEAENSLHRSPVQTPRSCNKNANEYIAMGIAAEAEKERLLELVTVLNRRLDKERCELEQSKELFKKERNKNAKLETKLQKMELERVGLSRSNPGSYRFKQAKATVSANEKYGNIEEFQLKFELLQEECLTLKTRLATLQKEKAADLSAFKKMLEQTRKIFKDAFRGKLPTIENQGCHSSVITI